MQRTNAEQIMDAFADTVAFLIALLLSPIWFPLWAYRRLKRE